jgi:YjbE family integral membrane protein
MNDEGWRAVRHRSNSDDGRVFAPTLPGIFHGSGMSLDLLTQILSIIVINVILSGDNALVIGMASRTLAPQQRRMAIILGGAGAIVLRVIFTAVAAIFLQVPFLEAAGGVILSWIAYKLLNDDANVHEVKASDSLFAAIKTIIVADVVMSLDNMLAIGGAAHGSIELLLFGLGLSMPFILLGSNYLARLLNRFPWLMIGGSGVLAVTAARMIVDDKLVDGAIRDSANLPLFVGLSLLGVVIVLVPMLLRWRRERAAERGSGGQRAGSQHPL